MTHASAERIAVPPITCELWCEYPNGHADEIYREDQTCFSQYDVRVPLTLHPLIEDDQPGPNGPAWEPEVDSVQVFAAKRADSPTEVWLVHEGMNCAEQWQFTPAEAQQPVEKLQYVLGQIEQAVNA